MLSNLLQKFRRTTSSLAYMPEIDGLRFLAIAVVAVYHINNFILYKSPFRYDITGNWLNVFISNGFKGVQIFFVISGFVLALPFARYFFQSEKKPVLKKYYLRRLTRLEPPYFVVLIVCVILYLIKGEFTLSQLAPGLLLNFFYVHNIIPSTGPSILGILLWTLEIEVQFYLILPLIVQVFRMSKFVRRSFLVGCILALPLLNVYLKTDFIWLFNYLYYFLIGVLIADIYISEKHPQLNQKLTILGGTLIFIILMFINIDDIAYKYIFIVTLFVLVYLVLTDNIIKRIFSSSIIASVGGMCYTIYMLHTVIISGIGNSSVFWRFTSSYSINIFLQMLILIPPTVIICSIFYLFVEKPCMDKDWPSKFVLKVKLYFNRMRLIFVKEKID